MRYMLETEGVLNNEEFVKMLCRAFSLDTKVTREVMVPRTDDFMIDINDSVEDNVTKVYQEKYSRIPGYNEEDKDKVVGILHRRIYLKAAHKFGFDHLDLQKIMQEPLFVPETTFIDDLLCGNEENTSKMAILLRRILGGVVGLATLEDC